MPRLILASGSPYRRELLSDAGYEVEAVSSGIAEPDLALFPDLHAGLIHIAQLKALGALAERTEGLILAADTVSHVRGSILGKPVDRADARRMLELLSGCTHAVLTGWCLLRVSDRLALSGVETTIITMRAWSNLEIEAYLDSGEWEGKCGAYGLLLPADPFVTRIEGSAANVIGVPLERLAQVLNEFPGLLLDAASEAGA